jgi:plastocyanin
VNCPYLSHEETLEPASSEGAVNVTAAPQKHRSRLVLSAVAACALGGVAVLPCVVAAQGTVTGRVSLTERPGEPTKDIANGVVYLVRMDSASDPTRPSRTRIAMNGRTFVPRVRVVTPGSRVAFPNQDPFSHNIFSTTPGAVFDLGLYPSGKSKEAPFRRPGAYPVYCNIHPRMTAYVVVSPTPWYTQVGNDGRWSIAGVPAGRYQAHFWHERTAEHVIDIEVGPSGRAAVDVELDARGFRFAQHKNKFGKEYDKTGKDRY